MFNEMMIPYLNLQISWFGITMVIAFLITNIILRKDIVSAGHDPSLADDITFRAALGGVLGAKLYCILELSITDWDGFINQIYAIYDISIGLMTFYTSDGFDTLRYGLSVFGSGLVFLGGFVGGMLNVYLLIRKKDIKWLVVCDIAAPLVALGHGIGRIGCFFVGDDYGIRTNSFIGVHFPYAKPKFETLFSDILPGEIVYVYPTQIFEMIIYFLIFLYLRYIVVGRGLYKFHGQIICEFLFLHGLGRLLVEFIRTNPSVALGLSGAQIISIAMMCAGSIFFYLKNSMIEKEHNGIN